MVQPLGENRDETTNCRLGDLSGIPLTDDLVELLRLWDRLSAERKDVLLTELREAIRDATDK